MSKTLKYWLVGLNLLAACGYAIVIVAFLPSITTGLGEGFIFKIIEGSTTLSQERIEDFIVFSLALIGAIVSAVNAALTALDPTVEPPK